MKMTTGYDSEDTKKSFRYSKFKARELAVQYLLYVLITDETMALSSYSCTNPHYQAVPDLTVKANDTENR